MQIEDDQVVFLKTPQKILTTFVRFICKRLSLRKHGNYKFTRKQCDAIVVQFWSNGNFLRNWSPSTNLVLEKRLVFSVNCLTRIKGTYTGLYRKERFWAEIGRKYLNRQYVGEDREAISANHAS